MVGPEDADDVEGQLSSAEIVEEEEGSQSQLVRRTDEEESERYAEEEENEWEEESTHVLNVKDPVSMIGKRMDAALLPFVKRKSML